MSEKYFKSIPLSLLYATPEIYPWNCLLYFRQFSKQELIDFKEFVEIVELVKHQESATYEFVLMNFKKEVDECDLLDWGDVEKYTQYRK
jgi:hypothetical protein